jgi:ArsR family transcriptional regulator
MKALTAMLKALSDPTRLRILEILHRRGETCVCELEAALGMTQSNISFHLHTLRKAGLVARQKVGKWVFYTRDKVALSTCLNQLAALFAPERADTERSSEGAYVRCQREDLSRAEVLAEAGGSARCRASSS